MSRKVLAALGIGGLVAGGVLLLSRKAKAAPAPGTFTGFSLELKNAPADAAYWIADFPYHGYPGKTPLLPINKGGYILEAAPGLDTVRISLLKSDFSCVDPLCAGREFTYFFADGQHYLLDLSIPPGEEPPGEEPPPNPDPPPLPEPLPEGEPGLIGITIPDSVAAAQAFTIQATIVLPLILGDNTAWFFTLYIEGEQGDEGRIRQTLAVASFLAPELAAKEALTYLPLDNPDDIYDVEKQAVVNTPGSYPVMAELRYMHASWFEGPEGGVGLGSPTKTYDLGVVGALVVT